MAARSYTLFDLADAVREVAAERPDFVYKRRDYPNHRQVCVYTTPDGVPDCIIGVALAKVGDAVPAWDCSRDYRCNEDRELGSVGGRSWRQYWDTDEAELDVLKWLTSVQARQDSETPWQQAVELSDSYYPGGTNRPVSKASGEDSD